MAPPAPPCWWAFAGRRCWESWQTRTRFSVAKSGAVAGYSRGRWSQFCSRKIGLRPPQQSGVDATMQNATVGSRSRFGRERNSVSSRERCFLSALSRSLFSPHGSDPVSFNRSGAGGTRSMIFLLMPVEPSCYGTDGFQKGLPRLPVEAGAEFTGYRLSFCRLSPLGSASSVSFPALFAIWTITPLITCQRQYYPVAPGRSRKTFAAEPHRRNFFRACPGLF
jgi:hypothetical protein